MSGYAEYDMKLFDLQRVKVPTIVATPENFASYGHFVYNFEHESVIIKPWPVFGKRKLMGNTGIGGGIAEGIFEYTYETTQKNKPYLKKLDNIITLHSINNAVGGKYITGIGYDNIMLVREANYHPDSGQVFYPMETRPFSLLLSDADDNATPEDFVCFSFDGTCGCQINPNIWHQPIYPSMCKTMNFKNKQGAVHACVGIDFVDEFYVVLEITI